MRILQIRLIMSPRLQSRMCTPDIAVVAPDIPCVAFHPMLPTQVNFWLLRLCLTMLLCGRTCAPLYDCFRPGSLDAGQLACSVVAADCLCDL